MKYKTVVTHNTTHEGAGRVNFLASVFVLRGGFSSFASFPKGVGLLFVVFFTNKNPRLANVLKAWDKNLDKKLSGGIFFYTQERWEKNKINFLWGRRAVGQYGILYWGLTFLTHNSLGTCLSFTPCA